MKETGLINFSRSRCWSSLRSLRAILLFSTWLVMSCSQAESEAPVAIKAVKADTVSAAPEEAASLGFRIELVGAPEVVYDANPLDCRTTDGRKIRNDHPDIAARAFRDSSGTVHLLASSRRNFELAGPTLDGVKRRSCNQIFTGGGSNEPSHYDQFHWLAAVYTENGKDVVGLTHQEFHGDIVYPECKPRKDNAAQRCMMTSINLVSSNNSGASFKEVDADGPPLIASPYKFSKEARRIGYRAPTNIVMSPSDGHYYFLFNADAYKQQKSGACVLRSRNMNFQDARAWDGTGFEIAFASPYFKEGLRAGEHICTPVVDFFVRSLTYNTEAKSYLLLGHNRDEVVYAWSKDLTTWSSPQTLMPYTSHHKAGSKQQGGAAAYHSFLDPSSSSRSFETTGDDFFVYFTTYSEPIKHKSGNIRFTGRALSRQKVKLIKNSGSR